MGSRLCTSDRLRACTMPPSCAPPRPRQRRSRGPRETRTSFASDPGSARSLPAGLRAVDTRIAARTAGAAVLLSAGSATARRCIAPRIARRCTLISLEHPPSPLSLGRFVGPVPLPNFVSAPTCEPARRHHHERLHPDRQALERVPLRHGCLGEQTYSYKLRSRQRTSTQPWRNPRRRWSCQRPSHRGSRLSGYPPHLRSLRVLPSPSQRNTNRSFRFLRSSQCFSAASFRSSLRSSASLRRSSSPFRRSTLHSAT